MGQSIEEIEKLVEENNSRSSLENDIRLESTMDFIYENAEISKLKPVPLEEFARNKMGN